MTGATLIETITVTRPMKVIASTCCTITVFFLFASISSSSWVSSQGWREGLFAQCVSEGAPTPLPFDAEPVPGCERAHSASYIRGVAALMIIGLLTDIFGTLCTGLGLRSTDPNKKYKYYRVAIYALLFTLIALALGLIIYPVSLSKDIATAKKLDGGRVQAPKDVGSLDFDGDGILDINDVDDDNDGVPDASDPDDDNDGIPDTVDDDDDNDGIPDDQDKDVDDQDGDGVPDDVDDDDDNDGQKDSEDNDDDNDGIPDALDNDDDNDGIPDNLETDSDGDGIVDAHDTDDDNDGIEDSKDPDDDESVDKDNDGVPDSVDNDDDNDGIPDDDEEADSDGDGVADSQDRDDDNDGIPDDIDNDDDNDGIPDDDDIFGHHRVWEFGFGYGASWSCVILIFASVVLLICDRESEEIFYKERPVDEEEGGEEEGEGEKEDA